MDNKNYICMMCNKCFRSNYELNRHKNKKIKCVSNKYKLEDIDNLKVLINIIQIKDDELFQKKVQIDNQNNKILLLEKQIEQIMNITKNKMEKEKTNRTTNNVNKGTINNINITLSYGKEATDHITNKQYNTIFKRSNKSVPYLVLLKHFDVDKPENHNVYISNMRDEYAHIFTGDKWAVDDKEYILHQLYIDNLEFLMEKYDDMKKKEELSEISIKKFDLFIEKRENKDVVANVKKDIKKVLYNNRNIVI